MQAIGNNVIPLWMASRGYTIVQQNNLPTITHATGIVATFAYCYISDKLRSRWQCSLAIGFTFIISSAILVSSPAADAAYFFAFYLMGTTYAPQALWYSWMADLTGHDLQLRAITTGFMNSFDFAFVTWWPLIFFPVTDAPNYRSGYLASLVTGCLTIPVILLISYLEKRGRRAGNIGRAGEGNVVGNDDLDAPPESVRRCSVGSAKRDSHVGGGTEVVAVPPIHAL